jgi:hypothetical protein
VRPDFYTPEQRRAYMTAWDAARLAEARAYLGGCCVDCGTADDLNFDHVDPATKVRNVTKMVHASRERFWAEVRKCALRCVACHKAKSTAGRENNQRFTADEVRALRLRFAAGNVSKRAIARECGTSPSVIRRLVAGETYGWVT